MNNEQTPSSENLDSRLEELREYYDPSAWGQLEKDWAEYDEEEKAELYEQMVREYKKEAA